MTEQDADKYQQWKGMPGVTAYHLIERHAENWDDIGKMMAAWLRANTPDLCPVIQWLENGCDPKEAVQELRIYQGLRSTAKVTGGPAASSPERPA